MLSFLLLALRGHIVGLLKYFKLPNPRVLTFSASDLYSDVISVVRHFLRAIKRALFNRFLQGCQRFK